jgi:FtsP/CotA-like multicopper oxidase with cupredoxin domain
MLTRRELLKRGVAAPVAFTGARSAAAEGLLPSPATQPFVRRLPIPRPHLRLNRPGATPLELAKAESIYQQAQAESRYKAEPVPPAGECDYYEVVAREGVQEIIPGMLTRILGYNGLYPGPTFFSERNRPAVVRFVNQIPDEIMSPHYHGAHTPPDSDGVPMLSYSRSDVIAPVYPYAGARTFVFTNDNPFPATLWYHDHGEDCTAENVYHGLAGFYLLTPNSTEEDADIRAVEAQLPSGYGRYDIPLVFQDRQFNADGSLAYDNFEHDGFIGDRFLVNGVIQPYLPVARRKYRFRLLNGSNARHYEFFLSSGHRFFVIGSDGGLLPEPVEMTSLRIAPAERYEIVVDFSRYAVGSRVYLHNCLTQTSGRKPDDDPDDELDMDECVPFIEFQIARDEDDPSTIPDLLHPRLAAFIDEHLTERPGLQVKNSHFELERGNGAWQINGKFYDPNRVDLVEKLWTHSTWTFENSSGGWVHPMHIHDEQFAIVSRDGRRPPPHERGLKDTFNVGRGETVKVAAYWTGALNVGRYVFHCHNLEHEDMRMMGIFEVVP